MEYLSLFIIPLASAAIAYATNLLAITMLFRPHREILIFGRRLPFTPGLVPRQQKHLARKMGESLAENILTSQALVEAASNTGIVDNVVNIVQGFVDNIVTSDKELSKILAEVLKRNENEIIYGLVQNSEKLTSKMLEAARKYAENKALPYLQSEDFAGLLKEFAKTSLENAKSSGKKLSDIIPSGVAASIKSAAKNNMYRIAPVCRKFLADDRADARLRELVGKIAKDNASGLLGLFVNGDKIYDSIVQNLLKYLDDTKNHDLIYDKLSAFIDKMLARELAWFVGQIKHDETQIDKWMDTTIASIQENLRQEHVNKIFDGLAQSIAPEKAVMHLLSLSPSQIFQHGGVFGGQSDYKASVDKLVRNAVAMLAQKAGEHIVGMLDVAKIAEERINAFETQEMERLVKTVAGIHLKWIVRLGGLLGFIMGFFPAIFNLLF